MIVSQKLKTLLQRMIMNDNKKKHLPISENPKKSQKLHILETL